MKKFWLIFVPGILCGISLFIGGSQLVKHTSESEYCASCHIHPQAIKSWKQSVHYITRSGNRIECVECHLPPKGDGYLYEKALTGIRDVWGKWTKDPESFNWEERSRLGIARTYVPEESCLKCHKTLFTPELTREGEEAHLYYDQAEKTDDLHCINCHLNVGHYMEGYTHGGNKSFGLGADEEREIFAQATIVNSHVSFTEQIPGSTVSFNMKAIPGGSFLLGSPDTETMRDVDEGPQVEVIISPFFMAEIEVSWDEYLAFYAQTSGEGRSTDTEGARTRDKVDAISGATPPYGQPDQGWGMGSRPAISISFHAAETYCRWLSVVTGKTYRLPTEAEWEYACRAGSETPYFFEGDSKDFERTGFMSKLRKDDTTIINTYVSYQANSPTKTREPWELAANDFGLRNMPGNVAEYCSDWYSPEIYQSYNNSIKDPSGPASGEEHVIRGGSFRDKAGALRSANRDYTRTDNWLRTDPQIPKSQWWYSDCFYVGFRVVCVFDENTGLKN